LGVSFLGSLAAYLADSPETALYESVFRREVRNCHWNRLLERTMVTFETRASVHLMDERHFTQNQTEFAHLLNRHQWDCIVLGKRVRSSSKNVGK
jgi:hypothetical protein